MESERKVTGLRDASFSCYLTTPAEISSFAAKLTEPTAAASFPLHHDHDMAKHEDNGIGVFRAEKYFNTRHEDAHRSPRIIDTLTGKYVHESDAIDPRRTTTRQHKRQQVVVGTPSVTSEASSTTAQSTFLIRNSSSSSSPRGSREKRPFFPAFPCRGSCSDKKSLHVSTKQAEAPHSTNPPVTWEGRKVQSKSRLQNPEQEEEEEEEEGRKSLEVFGSRSMKKEDGIIAIDLERKLSVLTWDAIPNRQQQIKQTLIMKPKPMKKEVPYDELSDASSDLFEIETASGTTRPKQDNEGCVTPMSRYAPSEASVDWSVVTASAADFSFAASEYGDRDRKMAAAGSGMRGNSGNATAKGRRSSNGNGGGGGILSCKSLKGVEVAETVVVHKEKLYSAPSPGASKQKVTGR